MRKIGRRGIETGVLLRFNFIKFLSVVGFGPFEIYSLLFMSSTELLRIVFGGVLISSMVISIAIGPYIGTVMDSSPRKRIIRGLLSLWIIAFSAVAITWNLFPGLVEYIIPAAFVFEDVTGGVFFSSMRALQQTITTDGNYVRSNAFSEISGQLPTVVGAATAIPVLLILGPKFTPVLAVTAMIGPILILKNLEERFTPSVGRARDMGRQDRTIGFIRKHLSEVLFFYLLNFTFIAVMIGNFLKPVFIVEVLHGTAESISISEIAYAVAGSATGVFFSLVPAKGKIWHLYLCISLFAVGSLLIPFSPDFLLFLAFQSLHGTGNPGARITRNTIIMAGVPSRNVGRFYEGISFLSNITRLLLLISVTGAISFTGPGILIEATGIMVLATMILSLLLYFRIPAVRQITGNAGILSR